MYGKRWLFADGTLINISDLNTGELVRMEIDMGKLFSTTAGRTAKNCAKFISLLEELAQRDEDRYTRYYQNLVSIAAIEFKMEFPYTDPIPNYPKFVPQKVLEARTKNEKLAQETREINWQNLEAQMLPEGDHDKIMREDLYCDVHPITRRLVQNPLNHQFPYFTKVRGGQSQYKKCRITIEVLED